MSMSWDEWEAEMEMRKKRRRSALRLQVTSRLLAGLVSPTAEQLKRALLCADKLIDLNEAMDKEDDV